MVAPGDKIEWGDIDVHLGWSEEGQERPLSRLCLTAAANTDADRRWRWLRVEIRPRVPSRNFRWDLSAPGVFAGTDEEPVDAVTVNCDVLASEEPPITEGFQIEFDSHPPVGSNDPEAYANLAQQAASMALAAAQIRFGRVQ